MKNNHDENAAIEDTAAVIAAAIRKHVDRADQRAKEALTQLVDARTQLKRSQEEVQTLTAECGELKHALDDATAAKAHAESRYHELVAASQKLTEGLSRTLSAQREQPRPAPAEPAKRSEPPQPPKETKKPLQFPGPARDSKRVRIREGSYISVDGIPGQLIDLSLGGLQAVLTQMVKPNQLVRVTAPTAAGQLICKGRVVWVVYEQPGTSMSVYRLGVKFSDIDTRAVEDFMKDFAELPSGKRVTEIA